MPAAQEECARSGDRLSYLASPARLASASSICSSVHPPELQRCARNLT
jgi:hypothetical protein